MVFPSVRRTHDKIQQRPQPKPMAKREEVRKTAHERLPTTSHHADTHTRAKEADPAKCSGGPHKRARIGGERSATTAAAAPEQEDGWQFVSHNFSVCDGRAVRLSRNHELIFKLRPNS
jgi:hypothetical protein